ncbi:MAG TPA: ABC transporter substrate-binding protein, partial [Acidimicrobiales bacterium]|nr:ABC transporter substrate-binding protein [Acidimicrobiales bacterium]
GKDDSGASATTAGAATSGAATTGGPVTTGGSAAGGITGGGGGDGEIKIGYVTPATGALAPFAAADDFITSGINDFLQDGLMVGGKSYKVTIIVEDSESDPNTAGEKAGKLINQDAVDLMVVASTPDTTNPVSSQCEANSVPCISTVAPWQPWFFGQNGDPATGFTWAYHFFWGLEDVIAIFLSMWNQVPTNKQVGALFPNDPDGNAWGDATNGFPKPLADAGYTLHDPGRYENGNQDFTAQISAFKSANCEVLTGVVIPPDFPTFWKQAKQQGYVPKAASIGKALLFPESIQALGNDGVNLSSEVWWSPNHPYKSSLTQVSAKDLTDAYTQQTSKQWTQPIGFVHALFEVAIAAFVAAGGTDKAAVRDSISKLSVDTIVGPVAWGSGPVKNVAKTKLVGGQWRTASTPTGFDLVVVDNSGNPDVPATSTMQPIA